jgi:signal transduction histidine kinase
VVLLRWWAFRAWVSRISPRARDVAFIGLTLIGTSGYVFGPFSEPRLPLGVVGSVSAVAAGALWWRRRYPARVALVGFAAYALTEVPMAAYIGLFTLAVRRRDRVLALVAATGFAVEVIRSTVVGTGVLTSVVGALLTIGGTVASGAFIGARRDLVSSLRDRAERAESERELRAERARLGERNRIAGEMHDVLAHKVSLIALHAGALEVNADAGAEVVERTAALVRSTARDALDDLRRVLGVLRADGTSAATDLSPLPGIDAIPELVASSRAAGVTITLDQQVNGNPPDPVGRTAHRVVQEALTNVHKHARATSTEVRLRGEAGSELEVSVRNRRPVASGALLPGAGMGLVGLAERVTLAGGTLTSGQTADGGWQVTARLPWKTSEET